MADAINASCIEDAFYLKSSDQANHSGHGECLHHVLEHYIKTLRKNPKAKRDEAFKQAHRALQKFFDRENRLGFLVLSKPKNRQTVWTVKQIKVWALKCLRAFIVWVRKEQIVWIEEELSLHFTLKHKGGSAQKFNLGRPDLVAYSAKSGRYMVIDYKTSQKSVDENLDGRIVRQLLKHVLGLHLYYKKCKPPIHLLAIDTVALFFPIEQGSIAVKPRFWQTHNPYELFRRKGKNWARLQARYKPLVKNFNRAVYIPAKR